MDKKAFGKEVERCRVASGLNQEQFRAVFGVSQQTVSNWENGTIPQPEHLAKLCKMAGLDVDEIAKLRAKRKKTLVAASQNQLGLLEPPSENNRYFLKPNESKMALPKLHIATYNLQKA